MTDTGPAPYTDTVTTALRALTNHDVNGAVAHLARLDQDQLWTLMGHTEALRCLASDGWHAANEQARRERKTR